MQKNANFSIFRTKDILEVFNEKIHDHLTKVFNRNKSDYFLMEINSIEFGTTRIEVNIDKISDNELVLFVRDISGVSKILASYEESRQSLNELKDTVPIGLFQMGSKGQ